VKNMLAHKVITNITKRTINQVLLIAITILLIFPLFNPPPYILHILIVSFLYAYLCTAWSFISGYAGQVSLGHSVFFGTGAYSIALLTYYYNVSPLLGLLLGIVASTFLALAIGVPSFKIGLKGIYYIFTTVALAEFLTQLFIGLRTYTGGELGLALPITRNPWYLYFESKVPYYYIAMGLWLFSLILAKKIQNSRFGYYLFAIRDDERAALACGINVFREKLKAHLLSAILTSIGGSIYAVYYLYVTPGAVFGVQLSFMIATTALFGGATSWIGPSIGAFTLVPFLEYTRMTLGGTFIGYPQLMYGVLLIIVARLIPGGLSEILFKGKERVR